MPLAGVRGAGTLPDVIDSRRRAGAIASPATHLPSHKQAIHVSLLKRESAARQKARTCSSCSAHLPASGGPFGDRDLTGGTKGHPSSSGQFVGDRTLDRRGDILSGHVVPARRQFAARHRSRPCERLELGLGRYHRNVKQSTSWA